MTARASDFRDGDIVEVRPSGWQDTFQPFQGVVDSRATTKKGMDTLKWVWVRRFGSPNYSGGWYPSQCRRIARPKADSSLPIPENIILGSN